VASVEKFVIIFSWIFFFSRNWKWWQNFCKKMRCKEWKIFVYCLPIYSRILTYLLIYLLTHSMEQSSSWEANRVCS